MDTADGKEDEMTTQTKGETRHPWYYTFAATHNHCADPRYSGDGHPVYIYIRAPSLMEAQRDVAHSWGQDYTVDLTPVGKPVYHLNS